MHAAVRLALGAVVASALGFTVCAPAAAQEAAPGPFRKLAPGVERTIPIELDPRDTTATHDLVEIVATPDLKWTPKTVPTTRTLFEKAQKVRFYQTVTGLDLSFKPLRMIYVDMPQPSGRFQRKLIWYMVYRVTNRAGGLQPVKQEDGTYAIEEIPPADFEFRPMFSLYSHEEKKEYLDQVIPIAIGPIQQREDPNRRLLTTVEMTQKPIPPSTAEVDNSVWGVVTWEDVDPKIDFLSLYVGGLTNAYQWTDTPGAYKPGDNLGKGRKFAYKTLKINFWRPGDQFLPNEKEIRYGTPPGMAEKYGVPAGVDYTWVFR